MLTRIVSAWRALDHEQHLAALGAFALLVTMFFPWYGLQSLNRKSGVIYSHDISAFGDVSFVEAAIFLVAAGVGAMLFFRGEERDFHLPGGDGTIVMLAGCWAALLIFYRVFSRPAGNGYPVGIEWGFFLAFVAAGFLGYTGWRMRAAERPEPPLRRRRQRRSEDPYDDRGRHTAHRAQQGERAAGEDEVTVAQAGARPHFPPAPAGRGARAPASARPEQMSFEDQPPRE